MTAISRTTFDTNILIYSIDLKDTRKHSISNRIVAASSDASCPVALQCLNEFFRAVTRKGLLSEFDAARVVDVCRAAFRVFPATEADLTAAINLYRQHHLQFFDCLMVATALRAGCTAMFSEDLQNMQNISGMTILNPFKLSEAGLGAFLEPGPIG